MREESAWGGTKKSSLIRDKKVSLRTNKSIFWTIKPIHNPEVGSSILLPATLIIKTLREIVKSFLFLREVSAWGFCVRYLSHFHRKSLNLELLIPPMQPFGDGFLWPVIFIIWARGIPSFWIWRLCPYGLNKNNYYLNLWIK
jgi:hypothetical protein